MSVRHSGIYAWRTTNGLYVGSAIDLAKRERGHLSELRRGRHTNRFLQNAFNKHSSSFQFEILLLCDPADLIRCEQHFIDRLKPRYNIRRIADSQLGVKYSDASKEKIRRAVKEQWADPIKREKFVAANRRRYSTAEEKARLKSLCWDKAIEGVKIYWASKGTRHKRAELVRHQWKDPEIRAKRLAHWNDPLAREKHRIANSKRWDDPTQREKQRQNALNQWAERKAMAK